MFISIHTVVNKFIIEKSIENETMHFSVNYRIHHIDKRNGKQKKEKQSSRRSQGMANFAGFKERVSMRYAMNVKFLQNCYDWPE